MSTFINISTVSASKPALSRTSTNLSGQGERLVFHEYPTARKIKRYTHDLDFDSFMSDDKTMDAVVRNFEIIGEAANRIDPDFRDSSPEIEWKRIRGFRNRIVIISFLLFFLTDEVAFSQVVTDKSISVQGFIQNSGLSRNLYLKQKYNLRYSDYVLMAEISEQYLLESDKDISKYIGEYCKITGRIIEIKDNNSFDDCSIMTIDSIERVDFQPDYSKQDSLINAITQLLYRNEVIDTVQGFLERNERFFPSSFNDYRIKADKAVKFTEGETGAEFEMISVFSIYYLDINMMYDFEKYLRAGKKIKVEGFLVSGDAHSLVMSAMRILK